MSATISVNEWSKFQHYKDRDPPWIKLYRDILTTESWMLGTDASRLVQVAIILLAARYENKIPYRYALVRKAASLECSEDEFQAAIAHLATENFIEINGDTPACKQLASTVLATCTSETEQSRAETEQNTPVATLPPLSDSQANPTDIETVTRIFDHWKSVWSHPRAKLDEKRRALIRKALKHYSEADLCQCISGYLNSPHHCGQNDRNTVYDAIEVFLRDSKHIDAGLKFYENPPDRHSPKTRQIVDGISGWKPPELRGTQ